MPSDIRQPTSAIDLVVFDLGRVLLRIADSWEDAFARAGVSSDGVRGLLGDISIAAQRGHDPEVERVFAGFETGRVGCDDFCAVTGRAAGLEPATVRAVLDAWLIEPYPGVVQLLDELAELPVKTACLSNTNARHWQLITDPAHPAYLPIDRLDFAFASQLIGHAKPAAAAFEHVTTAVALAPSAVLFFDDLWANVDAARACGWHAEVIAHDGDPVSQLRRHLGGYGVTQA